MDSRALIKHLQKLAIEDLKEADFKQIMSELSIDYGKLHGESYLNKIRESITYLERRGQLEELLPLARSLFPNLDWRVPELIRRPRKALAWQGNFIRKFKRFLFKLKSARSKRTRPIFPKIHDLQHLIPILDTTLEELDLVEVCFDSDIDWDDFPGLNKTEKLVNLVDYLEKGFNVNQFWFSLRRSFPNINWAEMMDEDSTRLRDKSYQFQPLQDKSYDTFAIRQFFKAIWPKENDVLRFCENAFPGLRMSLSVENSRRKNIQAFLEAVWRRGTMDDILNLLQEKYPDEYSKFSPFEASN